MYCIIILVLYIIVLYYFTIETQYCDGTIVLRSIITACSYIYELNLSACFHKQLTPKCSKSTVICWQGTREMWILFDTSPNSGLHAQNTFDIYDTLLHIITGSIISGECWPMNNNKYSDYNCHVVFFLLGSWFMST